MVTGIVCSYDINVRDKLQIYLENHELIDCSEKQTEEYGRENGAPLFYTSMAGVVMTDAMKYIAPKNREEMMKRHDYKEYLKSDDIELENVIEKHKCFERLTEDAPDKFHTTKMVRKPKWFSDGLFDVYKSRLTLRGFSFVWLQDFAHFFSPVV